MRLPTRAHPIALRGPYEHVAMQLHPLEILQSLILISAANDAPLIAKGFFGDRYTRPIDGGLVLSEGNRPLGSSKAWRGLLAAILSSACAAVLIGLPVRAACGAAHIGARSGIARGPARTVGQSHFPR
ncbi:MAG: hypothetical protein JWM36_3107 [Hyphomicrobiales bacterium]|nr:hypothetical protein [Hyphomicrobiales bacterium]